MLSYVLFCVILLRLASKTSYVKAYCTNMCMRR
nr:MAG TPA: hypothetical protein [Caudoviricetes sp.]